MSEDSLVRQLEDFINKGGKIDELKRILSVCPDDEGLWKELIRVNQNK